VPLPGFMSGVSLGGPVTTESIVAAVYDGMRLATLLCCIGAANALANPKRALRALPAALYEVGVAITVAIVIAPQLVESVQRVRRARKLRGATEKGRRAVRGIAMPILHDSLDRSFALAAAMDARGYGRNATVPARTRRVTTALLLVGLVGLCVGAYAILDPTTPRVLGLPMLALGVLSAVGGLALGGKRVKRTQYRPDPWQFPEWATAACGVIAAAAMVVTGRLDAGALDPSVFPLAWPALPLLPVLGLAVALLPAVITPRPPTTHVTPAPSRAIDLTDADQRATVLA
jgi:energy-coupling factor transport system permease protein